MKSRAVLSCASAGRKLVRQSLPFEGEDVGLGQNGRKCWNTSHIRSPPPVLDILQIYYQQCYFPSQNKKNEENMLFEKFYVFFSKAFEGDRSDSKGTLDQALWAILCAYDFELCLMPSIILIV